MLWAGNETKIVGDNLAGRFDLMANQLGRRYECDSCGTTVLCTKAGDGVIRCCGSDMELQQPRKLPSSD